MPVLPLFPLGAVLLPGGPLRLQVFEHRYLALLRDLGELDDPDRVFGVVAIRRGHEVGEGRASDLYEVGCLAQVQAVELVRGQARTVYRLAAAGTQRFRVEGLIDVGRPYPTAEVTLLDDLEEENAVEVRRLGERLVSTFAAYRRAVGAPETHVSGPIESVAAQVIDAMPVGVADRQRVLEAGSGSARIRGALALVQRESAILSAFRAVPVPKGQISPN